MRYIKNPHKYAVAELKRRGGVLADSDRWFKFYQMPDGALIQVHRDVKMPSATSMVAGLLDRYPVVSGRDPVGGEKVSGAPEIDFANLTASDHAKERLALMQKQAAVAFPEIVHALRIPERVRWSEKHHSWIWVGARIAVAAHVTDDGAAIIKTLLWAKTELWDAFPRPEKELI